MFMQDVKLPEWLSIDRSHTREVADLPLQAEHSICASDGLAFNVFWFSKVEWELNGKSAAGSRGSSKKGGKADFKVVRREDPGFECKALNLVRGAFEEEGGIFGDVPGAKGLFSTFDEIVNVVLPLGHCRIERTLACVDYVASDSENADAAAARAAKGKCVVKTPFSRGLCLVLPKGFGAAGDSESVVVRIAFDMTYLYKLALGVLLVWFSPWLCRQRWFHYVIGATGGVVVGVAILAAFLLRSVHRTVGGALPSWIQGPMFLAAPAVLTVGVVWKYVLQLLEHVLSYVLRECVCVDKLHCTAATENFWMCSGILTYLALFGGGGMVFIRYYGVFLGEPLKGRGGASGDEDDDEVMLGESFWGWALRAGMQAAGIVLLLNSSASAPLCVLAAVVVTQMEVLMSIHWQFHMYMNAWDPRKRRAYGIITVREMEEQSRITTRRELAKLRKHCNTPEGRRDMDRVSDDHTVRLEKWARGSRPHVDRPDDDIVQRPSCLRRWCWCLCCCCGGGGGGGEYNQKEDYGDDQDDDGDEKEEVVARAKPQRRRTTRKAAALVGGGEEEDEDI
eukprot:g1798.t1